MTRLVLASASPARLRVLRAAGIDPVVRVSDVDEDALAASLPVDSSPETVVAELAKAKARTVAADIRPGADVCWLDAADAFDAVVLGCDSMLLIDGVLAGKPLTVDSARTRWAAMAGRSGKLLTGHSVLRLVDGEITGAAAATSATTVHFGRPGEDELEAYLASGEPLNVAGAFTIDGLGGWFIDRIEGDPSSVIGIGLPLTRKLLAEVGVTIAQLWNGPAAERTKP